MDESLENLAFESKGIGSTPLPAIELNTILAPIDFSPASRRGLAFAAGVAERFHSQIHLLYVVERPSLPEWGYFHLAFKEAKLRRAAKERIHEFPVGCGIAPALIGSATVRSGDAEFEICKDAVKHSADLIVIASHGLGGLKHAFIGSTSEGVVRHAPCSVLTIREHTFATSEAQLPSFAPKRILVTTDFSETSKMAIPYAVALARKFDASLMLVYVMPSNLPAELRHIGVLLEEKEMLFEARKQLPRFREAELDPNVHVETLVLM